MRLNTYLAHAGVCSRRNAIELIKGGQVSVNGKTMQKPGYEVQTTDKVTLGGTPVRPEKKVYIILNKPKGYVSTRSDEKGRKTVMDLVALKTKQRLYPIGRLDKDTTGVLLLTNDGLLAQKLAHPRYEIRKTYQVKLDHDLLPADLEKIRTGLRLEDGHIKVDDIFYSGSQSKQFVTIILHSGKKRIVRRIFQALGYWVKKLDRTIYAGLTYKGIPICAWRFLRLEEVKKLTALTIKADKKAGATESLAAITNKKANITRCEATTKKYSSEPWQKTTKKPSYRPRQSTSNIENNTDKKTGTTQPTTKKPTIKKRSYSIPQSTTKKRW